MQGELVWARARIAELEAAMPNHSRPLRQPETGQPPDSFSSNYQHEGGFFGHSSSSLPIPPIELEYVDKQQGAAMVEGLLQQRGILRELLRAELRDIARGRKRESSGTTSGEVCCLTPGDNAALNRHSVAEYGKQHSMLLAEHNAEVEDSSPLPSLVVPHPPPYSPELETMEVKCTLQPNDAGSGQSDTFWLDDGSAQEISFQAEQQSSQHFSLVPECGSRSLGSVESARMDRHYKTLGLEARNYLEPPKYGTSKSGPRAVTQQRVEEEFTSHAILLDGAADGPNDLVRIISRRNGGRLKHSNQSWDSEDTAHGINE
jgi:hypothetical protein